MERVCRGLWGRKERQHAYGKNGKVGGRWYKGMCYVYNGAKGIGSRHTGTSHSRQVESHIAWHGVHVI